MEFTVHTEKWDTLRRWKSTDCDSEYRALYASEYRMLCYYATKALVDLYGEAVN